MRDTLNLPYGTLEELRDEPQPPVTVDEPPTVTVFAQMILDGIGDVSVTKRLLSMCDNNVKELFLVFDRKPFMERDDSVWPTLNKILDELDTIKGCNKYLMFERMFVCWISRDDRDPIQLYRALSGFKELKFVNTSHVILYLNCIDPSIQEACKDKKLLQLGDPHTITTAQRMLLERCTNPKWTLLTDDDCVMQDALQIVKQRLLDGISSDVTVNDKDRVCNIIEEHTKVPKLIRVGLGPGRYMYVPDAPAGGTNVDERVQRTQTGTKRPREESTPADGCVLFAYGVRDTADVTSFIRECALAKDDKRFPYTNVKLIAPKFSESVTNLELKVNDREVTISVDVNPIPHEKLIPTLHYVNQQYRLPVGITGIDSMLECLHNGVHCVYCCSNNGCMRMWFTFMLHVFWLNSETVRMSVIELNDTEKERNTYRARFPWQIGPNPELEDFASSVYTRLGNMSVEDRQNVFKAMRTLPLNNRIKEFLQP